MTTSIRKKIQVALQTRLSSIPNIPLIAWPNQEEPDGLNNARVYLRPNIFFSTTTPITLGGTDQYLGFYQIDIFTSLDISEALMVQWQDIIDQYYKMSNRVLNNDGIDVIVTSIVFGNGATRIDNWHHGYIQINFTSFID